MAMSPRKMQASSNIGKAKVKNASPVKKMRGGGMVQKMNKGGAASKSKSFPDLTGDGKVTKKDILKGRGVKLRGGGMVKKGK